MRIDSRLSLVALNSLPLVSCLKALVKTVCVEKMDL